MSFAEDFAAGRALGLDDLTISLRSLNIAESLRYVAPPVGPMEGPAMASLRAYASRVPTMETSESAYIGIQNARSDLAEKCHPQWFLDFRKGGFGPREKEIFGGGAHRSDAKTYAVAVFECQGTMY